MRTRKKAIWNSETGNDGITNLPHMPHAVCSSRSAAELYAASAQALAEAAAEGLVLLRSSSSLSGYRGVLRDSQSTVGLKNPYRAQASLLAPLGRT